MQQYEREATTNMEPLDSLVFSSLTELSRHGDSAKIALRTHKVQSLYCKAIRNTFSSYPDGSIQLILQHTNAVYITRDNEWKTLIIYVDDSNVKSALDHNQYFIIQYFRECNEEINEYKLLTSRATMRSRHPFEHFCEGIDTITSNTNKTEEKRALNPEEIAAVDEMVRHVENPCLQEALKRAIIADFENKPKN